MEEIQTKRRGEWRTICTARGRVAEEGSHDAIEVFYALRKGAPLTFHDIRLVDEKGRVVAGGDEEEQMARTRDQFTGHVWLKRTGADRKYCQCPVWDMDTIVNNMDWLTGKGYLCLSLLKEGKHELQIFPTDHVAPGGGGNFAAHYTNRDLRACFQAAVNDYMHALARDTTIDFQPQRIGRGVQLMKEGQE